MTNGRRSDDSPNTRQRLLDAGMAALRDEPTQRVFENLQVRSIAARADLTTGAFYHHFNSQNSFAEALLDQALARNPNDIVVMARANFETAALAGASFAEAVLAGAEAVIRFQRSDPTFPLLLTAMSKASGDPELTARLKNMYHDLEDRTAPLFEQLLSLTGRELRPPFSLDELAGSIIALYEGLGLRQQVDPDAVPSSRLGLLILAISSLMTRPLGDVDEVGGWINNRAPRWRLPE